MFICGEARFILGMRYTIGCNPLTLQVRYRRTLPISYYPISTYSELPQVSREYPAVGVVLSKHRTDAVLQSVHRVAVRGEILHHHGKYKCIVGNQYVS